MMKVRFEVGGRSVDPNSLADKLMVEVLKAIEADLRAKIGSIRHPETGEFPVIVVRGRNLENLSIEVTGSPELVSLVNMRLHGGNEEQEINNESERETAGASPVAFLCHASEDKNLVRRLAHDLMNSGIDVFFDEWEIGPGESIRRKIDAGLGRCTHFIAVMTSNSVGKEWVNTEIDAAFIQKVEGRSKFIPLRIDLPVDALSPLLRSMHSPSMDDYSSALENLISYIHGISRKPMLGPSPAAVATRTPGLGISAAAEAIVRLMVERSEHGDSMDPQLTPDDIRSAARLSDDDIIDAVDELEGQGFVQRHRSLGCGAIGFHGLTPESELFVKFDSYFKPWDPEKDALRIAAEMVNGTEDGVTVQNLAASYEWPPRRMNPAINYLISRKLVSASESMGCHPWTTWWIARTPATRRFVRDRG